MGSAAVRSDAGTAGLTTGLGHHALCKAACMMGGDGGDEGDEGGGEVLGCS